MKDLTSANHKKTNYSINTYKLLNMSIQDKILEVLSGLTPSQQLRELEKLSKKIRKENSIRITKAVDVTRNKYPKK